MERAPSTSNTHRSKGKTDTQGEEEMVPVYTDDTDAQTGAVEV